MRLRTGEALAAAGGLALLATMFGGWYGGGGHLVSAWEAFSVTDVLLLVTALLALALAVAQVTQGAPALPVGLAVLTSAVAIVALVVLLYRLLNEPGPDDVVEVGTAAWLGLAALALVALGAWRSMGDEGPRSPDHVAAGVERRPAPPA